MAILDIKVPDIGDFDEVTVIELLVAVGDTVGVDQSLLTVESDKASMEIPCSHAGVVKEIKVALGDKVKCGSLLLQLESIEQVSSAVTPAPAAAPTPSVAAAPEPLAAPAPVGLIQVFVPDIGDFKDVTVIEVLVKEGEQVKRDQSLVTVESDKASMEIPSSAAGVVQQLKVKLGDVVNIGDLLLTLEGVVSPSAATPAPAPAAIPAAPAPTQAAVAPTPTQPPVVAGAPKTAVALAHQPAAFTPGLPHASPSVRKFARQLGVPLGEVKGSGPKGRITEQDVQAFSRAVMSGAAQTAASAAQQTSKAAGATGEGLNLLPWPQLDFAKFGPVERKELGRIKKIAGANLLRNAVLIPAVTSFDDADITDLEAFRIQTNQENAKSGVKLTMLAFLVKACVAALKQFPDFNSSLDGDALIYKQYYHIGFAADTPAGLMVPVIKDADKKGIFQISAEVAELAKKAREGKLAPSEMSGASFTISSLGGIGGRYFTPIINAPEVAILGVCRATTEPVWDGQAFQPRLLLPLSLTWDHRVVDGAAAARFNVYLIRMLADLRRVLL